jgi:hypothetical protein
VLITAKLGERRQAITATDLKRKPGTGVSHCGGSCNRILSAVQILPLYDTLATMVPS